MNYFYIYKPIFDEITLLTAPYYINMTDKKPGINRVRDQSKKYIFINTLLFRAYYRIDLYANNMQMAKIKRS